jgi:hypothetical protein
MIVAVIVADPLIASQFCPLSFTVLELDGWVSLDYMLWPTLFYKFHIVLLLFPNWFCFSLVTTFIDFTFHL